MSSTDGGRGRGPGVEGSRRSLGWGTGCCWTRLGGGRAVARDSVGEGGVRRSLGCSSASRRLSPRMPMDADGVEDEEMQSRRRGAVHEERARG